ncbi:MAG: sigma-54 dependent transcriptional regulator [Planctomycetota bacterium]|nr:sigma-54 dependent transcriptional regulator [Planctomycetota bacterium]
MLLEAPSGGIEDLCGMLTNAGHRVLRMCPGELDEERPDAAELTFQQLLAQHLDQTWDAILCDRDLVPLETLLAAGTAQARPPVLLLDGCTSFPAGFGASRPMEAGVFDVLQRPVAPGEVLVSLTRALEQSALVRENRDLKRALHGRASFGDFLTRDRETARILETARTVADTRATALINGESGTGKTLLARAIHGASARAAGPFIEVNCGALPDALLESELFGHAKGAFTGATADKLGRFEAADGGTIFLDEIGNASLELQVKLLRVIQEHKLERLGETRTRTVDVRLVCATHVDLEAAVAAGTFREDLYWRIHVVPLELPPLRSRPADIEHLANLFLSKFRAEYERPASTFSAPALARLAAHPWPGNVRQLEHTVERAVLLSTGEVLQPADLGPDFAAAVPAPDSISAGLDGLGGLLALGQLPPLRQALETPERLLICRALELTAGSRKATAAMLGINRTTLFNKMRKYGLLDPDSLSTPSAPTAPPGQP